jgi:PAB1-binding protein PBP1
MESTYDETHYTTKIDRSRPDFEDISRRADRVAREIESSTSINAHVTEERGLKATNDGGLDEESK